MSNPSKSGSSTAQGRAPVVKKIVTNRKARHEYEVLRTLEAGIVLMGTEVKSLRAGQVNVTDAYAQPEKGELFLQNLEISPYKQAVAQFAHAPRRARKLLLHAREIESLSREVAEKGLSLVPLELYFVDGRVKVEMGICRGRKHHDRRDAIADRETRREVDRELKKSRRKW